MQQKCDLGNSALHGFLFQKKCMLILAFEVIMQTFISILIFSFLSHREGYV